MATNPLSLALWAAVALLVLLGVLLLAWHEGRYRDASRRADRRVRAMPGTARTARPASPASPGTGRPSSPYGDVPWDGIDPPARPPSGPRRPPGTEYPTVPSTPEQSVGDAGERLVARVVEARGHACLPACYVETPWGYAQVDHLVRAGDAIVVIETKNWAGTLSGPGRSGRWSVRRPGKPDDDRHSPVRQVEGTARAIAGLLHGGPPVEHLVVLAGSARPPPGADPCVVALHDLPGRLDDIAARRGPDARGDRAWAELLYAVATTPQATAALAHAVDIGRRVPPTPSGRGLRSLARYAGSRRTTRP